MIFANLEISFVEEYRRRLTVLSNQWSDSESNQFKVEESGAEIDDGQDEGPASFLLDCTENKWGSEKKQRQNTTQIVRQSSEL